MVVGQILSFAEFFLCHCLVSYIYIQAHAIWFSCSSPPPSNTYRKHELTDFDLGTDHLIFDEGERGREGFEIPKNIGNIGVLKNISCSVKYVKQNIERDHKQISCNQSHLEEENKYQANLVQKASNTSVIYLLGGRGNDLN